MSPPIALPARLTLPEIAARKASAGRGAALAMVTAYDVASARLADRAGMDLLLVGDSLGMAVLGREKTLAVTMDEILHHARAVAAARPRAVIVGNMPFLSYHVSIPETIRMPAASSATAAPEEGASADRREDAKRKNGRGWCSLPWAIQPQSILPLCSRCLCGVQW